MEIWLMISKVGLSDKLESSRVISCLDTETCPSSGGRAKFVFFFKFELGRQLARRAALALLLVHITAPSRSSCSMLGKLLKRSCLVCVKVRAQPHRLSRRLDEFECKALGVVPGTWNQFTSLVPVVCAREKIKTEKKTNKQITLFSWQSKSQCLLLPIRVCLSIDKGDDSTSEMPRKAVGRIFKRQALRATA